MVHEYNHLATILFLNTLTPLVNKKRAILAFGKFRSYLSVQRRNSLAVNILFQAVSMFACRDAFEVWMELLRLKEYDCDSEAPRADGKMCDDDDDGGDLMLWSMSTPTSIPRLSQCSRPRSPSPERNLYRAIKRFQRHFNKGSRRAAFNKLKRHMDFAPEEAGEEVTRELQSQQFVIRRPRHGTPAEAVAVAVAGRGYGEDATEASFIMPLQKKAARIMIRVLGKNQPIPQHLRYARTKRAWGLLKYRAGEGRRHHEFIDVLFASCARYFVRRTFLMLKYRCSHAIPLRLTASYQYLACASFYKGFLSCVFRRPFRLWKALTQRRRSADYAFGRLARYLSSRRVKMAWKQMVRHSDFVAKKRVNGRLAALFLSKYLAGKRVRMMKEGWRGIVLEASAKRQARTFIVLIAKVSERCEWRRIYQGWTLWKRFVKKAENMKCSFIKLFHHMDRARFKYTFEVWKMFVIYERSIDDRNRSLRRMVAKAARKNLCSAFLVWLTNSERKARADKLLVRIMSRLAHGMIHEAFEAWIVFGEALKSNDKEKRWAAKLIKKTLERMLQKRLRDSFTGWQMFSIHAGVCARKLKRFRHDRAKAIKRVVVKLKQSCVTREAAAFAKWRESVLRRRSIDRELWRCLNHAANRKLKSVFATWQSQAKEGERRFAVCRRVLGQLRKKCILKESAAFSKWQDVLISWCSIKRDLGRCLKHARKRKLKRGFFLWCIFLLNQRHISSEQQDRERIQQFLGDQERQRKSVGRLLSYHATRLTNSAVRSAWITWKRTTQYLGLKVKEKETTIGLILRKLVRSVERGCFQIWKDHVANCRVIDMKSVGDAKLREEGVRALWRALNVIRLDLLGAGFTKLAKMAINDRNVVMNAFASTAHRLKRQSWVSWQAFVANCKVFDVRQAWDERMFEGGMRMLRRTVKRNEIDKKRSYFARMRKITLEDRRTFSSAFSTLLHEWTAYLLSRALKIWRSKITSIHQVLLKDVEKVLDKKVASSQIGLLLYKGLDRFLRRRWNTWKAAAAFMTQRNQRMCKVCKFNSALII